MSLLTWGIIAAKRERRTPFLKGSVRAQIHPPVPYFGPGVATRRSPPYSPPKKEPSSPHSDPDASAMSSGESAQAPPLLAATAGWAAWAAWAGAPTAGIVAARTVAAGVEAARTAAAGVVPDGVAAAGVATAGALAGNACGWRVPGWPVCA